VATLVRWEPFRELASLQSEMSRLLNGLYESGNGGSQKGWVPALDVWETENEVVYAFDLPGIPEDKLSVELHDDTLTVSGEREKRAEISRDGFYRFERRTGAFTRTVAVPQGTDESKIAASYRDGVLEVHVAKPEVSKPKRITIGGAAHPEVEGTAHAA
jgi:HSP20 family protein